MMLQDLKIYVQELMERYYPERSYEIIPYFVTFYESLTCLNDELLVGYIHGTSNYVVDLIMYNSVNRRIKFDFAIGGVSYPVEYNKNSIAVCHEIIGTDEGLYNYMFVGYKIKLS